MKIVRLSVLALASLSLTSWAGPYADSVVAFTPGTGGNSTMTNASRALGEPSRQTVDPDPLWGGTWPVDPFSGPYLPSQLVSLGQGGALTVGFSTPIQHDLAHPYGIDFIVFGHAMFLITNKLDDNWDWIGTPATDGTLLVPGTAVTRVSVSQDGNTFYPLNSALTPGLDGFYPTDGSGDFQKAVNPTLRASSFAGATLAEVRRLYNGSGGGAGFNLAWAQDAQGHAVALDRVSYVRVEVLSGVLQIDGLAAVAPPTTLLREDFSTDPAQHGWRLFGDASLFQWNPTNQNLEVTWDSSRSNSYYYHRLGTILARDDDFSLAFDVRMNDVSTGTNTLNTFELALGLLDHQTATSTNFFRGAGSSASFGPRNLVEFDYFPAFDIYDPTFALTAVSSNNSFAFAHSHPLTLSPGDTFHFEMTYAASNQVLRTVATRNGQPYGLSPSNTLQELSMAALPDFRVDCFSISSYSGAHQMPRYAGSILAHGVVDNLVVKVPAPPVSGLRGRWQNGGWQVEFGSRTNWTYLLERTSNWTTWTGVSRWTNGTGQSVRLTETNALPGSASFYRVRAERP